MVWDLVVHALPDALTRGRRSAIRIKIVSTAVLLVLPACRPALWETARDLQPSARVWARENGLPLHSESGLRAVLSDARVLGLGESAHGSLDVFVARAEITKRLIDKGWVRAVVLENDAWGTCHIDQYVRGITHDPSVLTRYTMGLYQHPNAREFFEWVRKRNLEGTQHIRVLGMDPRSSASCAEEIAECPRRERLCEQHKASQNHDRLRDEFMAENVLHILSDVGTGVVVWTHSLHAAKSPRVTFNNTRKLSSPMGWYLHAELGADYVAVNVTFVAGGVSAGDSGGRLLERPSSSVLEQKDFWLDPPPPGSLEGTLASTVATVFSLRSLPSRSEARAWFSQPHFSRSIGSVLSGWRAKKGSMFVGWVKNVPREAYDTVVVLPKSTPLQADWAPATRRKKRRNG